MDDARLVRIETKIDQLRDDMREFIPRAEADLRMQRVESDIQLRMTRVEDLQQKIMLALFAGLVGLVINFVRGGI